MTYGTVEIAPRVFYLGTRLRWMVSFMIRPLHSRGRAPDTHWIENWVGCRTSIGAMVKGKISCSNRESSPYFSIIQPVVWSLYKMISCVHDPSCYRCPTLELTCIEYFRIVTSSFLGMIVFSWMNLVSFYTFFIFLTYDSRRFQIFWEAAGLERGPLSLLRTFEELFEGKVAAPV
jgi:hypothetical protein